MLKKFLRLLLITAGLLLIPIVASRFVDGWAWSTVDYVFAAIMFFATGALFEIGRSMSTNMLYRAGFALALLGGFMLIWVTGAVGIIGNEDNPANLMYLAIVALGFFSAIGVRFQPRGLAKTMFLMAFGVALIPVIALIMKSTFQEIPEAIGTTGVFVLNSGFVFLFIGAGMLFKQSTLPALQTK